jgi:hypothetical protein
MTEDRKITKKKVDGKTIVDFGSFTVQTAVGDNEGNVVPDRLRAGMAIIDYVAVQSTKLNEVPTMFRGWGRDKIVTFMLPEGIPVEEAEKQELGKYLRSEMKEHQIDIYVSAHETWTVPNDGTPIAPEGREDKSEGIVVIVATEGGSISWPARVERSSTGKMVVRPFNTEVDCKSRWAHLLGGEYEFATDVPGEDAHYETPRA